MGSRAKLTAADLLGKRVAGSDQRNRRRLQHLYHPPGREGHAGQRGSTCRISTSSASAQELYNGTNLESPAGAKLTPELIKKAADLHVTNLWIIDPTVEKHSLAAMWNVYDHHYEPYEKFKNGKTHAL